MSVPQPVQDLHDAVTLFDGVAAGVRPEQLDHPTPCAGWTVRDLLAHLAQGAGAFARVLGEEPADGGYEATRDAQLRAIGREVDLTRPVTMPFGEVPLVVGLNLRGADSLVHAWDLAQATGQEVSADDGLVARYRAFSEQTLAQLPPGQTVFAPGTTPPAGATPLQELVALLGREVR